MVTSVQRSSNGFQATLSSGEVFQARRVVVAVGLTYYEHIPPELAGLSPEFLSHSSTHATLDRFKGRKVAVIGAGASAIDVAAILHQVGASVHVVARIPEIRFQSPPENLNPSRLDRIRTLPTGIGPGWKLFLLANLPLVFRQMPEKFRLDKVRRTLGPAPCWFTKEQVVGKVEFTLGVTVDQADLQNGQVRLQLSDTAGAKSTVVADHVIAATGYKTDLRRLTFLNSDMLAGIRSVENTPVLSSNFESTVPNLYFVGVTSANTFGPLLRFAFGAKFAAPRISRHLARTASRDFSNQRPMGSQSGGERAVAPERNQAAQMDHIRSQVNDVSAERRSVTAPKVLITDTNRWALSTRLAVSLSEAGCEVSAVCPIPGHPLLKTRAVKQIFPYNGLNPLKSLVAAIQEIDPDIIVPACDRGVAHLHKLYEQSRNTGAAGAKLARLIERSLGSPANYAIASSRHKLLALAREEGIPVPSISGLDTNKEREVWEAEVPLPWVLKADGTCGGGGVKIARTPKEAQEAFVQLPRIFRFTRAIKRLLINRDLFWLRSWLDRSDHPISVQSFIHGRPANCAVFAWEGRVLACIGVEVVSSVGSTGPASIVRLVDNTTMTSAASKIASRLGLSGFFGLDFVIEERTEIPYLIEMNPRAAPPCHLRLGEGRDIPGALWSKLTGQPIPEVPPVTENEMIAYYPQADGSTRALLPSCYQDFPHGEPELAQELLRTWPDTFFVRLFVRLSQKPASQAVTETARYPLHEQATPDQPSLDTRPH
jgi:thioredoxin reductase